MGQEAAGRGVPGAGAQDMLRRRMQGGVPLGGGQNIPAPAAQPQDNPAPPSPPRMMAAPQGGGMTVQNPYQQQPPPPQGSTLNTEKWAAGTPQGEGQTLRAVDTATQPRRQQMTAPKVEPGAQIGPEMGRPTPNNPSPNGPSRQGGGPQIKPAIGAPRGGGYQAPTWGGVNSGSAGQSNAPKRPAGAQPIQNPYAGGGQGMGRVASPGQFGPNAGGGPAVNAAGTGYVQNDIAAAQPWTPKQALPVSAQQPSRLEQTGKPAGGQWGVAIPDFGKQIGRDGSDLNRPKKPGFGGDFGPDGNMVGPGWGNGGGNPGVSV